jgi:hypothetical protein
MRPLAGLTKRVGGLTAAKPSVTVARAAKQPIVPDGAGKAKSKAKSVKAAISIDPPATGDAWRDRAWASATGVAGASLCWPISALGHGPARPRASFIAIMNLPHGNSIGRLLMGAKAWGAREGEP